MQSGSKTVRAPQIAQALQAAALYKVAEFMQNQ